jgi:hypothetical protein
VLARPKWDAIADPVRAELNQRLKARGIGPGRWKTGGVHLSRLLGKELTLLAWAIEDADPALVPNALKNLAGARPGGALVALHDDRGRHRPRGLQPRQGLA